MMCAGTTVFHFLVFALLLGTVAVIAISIPEGRADVQMLLVSGTNVSVLCEGLNRVNR